MAPFMLKRCCGNLINRPVARTLVSAAPRIVSALVPELRDPLFLNPGTLDTSIRRTAAGQRKPA